MAAQTMTMKSTGQTRIVIAFTVIALLVGWGVKSFVEGQTRPVTQGGISAEVPSGWQVDTDESGPLSGGSQSTGLVFTARDPLAPETRYLVSSLPGSPEGDLATTAAIRNLQRAQSQTAYRVLEQTPVTLEGRAGYRVTFAYVDAGRIDQVPVVYEGVEYYFAEGDRTIVVTLETTLALEEAIDGFRDFASEVGLGE